MRSDAELLAAWGRGDGQAYGALFTDDAEYIAFDGAITKGRRTIADWHQQLFDTWLKGTRLVGQIDSLRFLGADTAVIVASGASGQPWWMYCAALAFAVALIEWWTWQRRITV